MKRNCRSILLAVCALAGATAVTGQPREPNVALEELLDRVASASNRSFLVDRLAPESIVLAGVDASDVDYATLRSVLRNNGLAAVEIDGHVNIVPIAVIRQYPLPIVSPGDSGIADDEWVSSVIEPQGMQAVELVPILRPLMPQEAALAASRSENKLIIVDRFGNLRRIAALIDSLE